MKPQKPIILISARSALFELGLYNTLVILLLTALFFGTQSHDLMAKTINATHLYDYDFQPTDNNQASPGAWTLGNGVTWAQEGNNRFLRLTSIKPDHLLTSYLRIPLLAAKEENHTSIKISFKVKYRDIKPGNEAWFDGRLICNFLDEQGNRIGKSPNPPYFRGTQKKWKTRTIIGAIPEQATHIELMPSLFRVNTGELDIDDIIVERIHHVPAKPPLAKTLNYSVKGSKPHPASLHVDGPDIKDSQGNTVWLQGVAVPSLEWNPRGDYSLNTVVHAIEEWKANVIRLAIKDSYWFGDDKSIKDGGVAYRALIDDLVEACATRGTYIILDLHRYRAPSQATINFWKDCATRYKDHPAVLFGLLNEPHSITWEQWLNGGTIKEKVKPKDGVISENNIKYKTFESPGMQAVLDAVRSTGAKNICVVGGLDWAYDLSGILKGYALRDPEGNGIVYDSHVYPWKSNWQGKFLDLVGKHPILLGENGAPKKRMSFIPPERHEEPKTWVPDLLGCVQKYKLHWTAWSFHPSASPCVLNDWNYTPSPHWGAHVKSALAGKAYTMKRMR